MMRSEMKKARKPAEANIAKGNITKSVSMPSSLWPRVAARVQAEPDLDFSKYVRRLIRKDVETAA